MGHSPQVHVTTYAHVIDGMQGTRYASLDELLQAARANLECRGCSASSR